MVGGRVTGTLDAEHLKTESVRDGEGMTDEGEGARKGDMQSHQAEGDKRKIEVEGEWRELLQMIQPTSLQSL